MTSERAGERASIVVAVVGAAAATVTVRRPERVSERAIEVRGSLTLASGRR